MLASSTSIVDCTVRFSLAAVSLASSLAASADAASGSVLTPARITNQFYKLIINNVKEYDSNKHFN